MRRTAAGGETGTPLRIAALIALLAGSVYAQAQPTCASISTASASGILGSAATSKASPNTCNFTAGHDRLRIRIGTRTSNWKPTCNGDMEHLAALGNEAVECSDGKQSEVTGRVRDQVVTITVFSSEASAEKLRQVAPQVVGHLY